MKKLLNLHNGKTRVGSSIVAVGLAIASLAQPAQATTYRLERPGDGVVGDAFYLTTRQEDTLLDVARHNNLGYDDMKHANQRVDMWVPGDGTNVLIPAMFVLPNAPRNGIVLNVAEKRLYYYPSSGEVMTYAISIGREGWNTPLGNFHITRKVKDPTWTPPASIRAEHAEKGEILPAVVPAGPDNPLGQYALRLSAEGYLIHGTNKPWGLGMQVSHGCIRMYPEGIEDLFPKVTEKTPVTIVSQPFKTGWLGDDLYLEVHATDDDKAKPLTEVVPPAMANAQGVSVDWEEVRKAVEENTGLPHLVGGRQKPGNWLYLDMIF
jgi:L,D-transpeptidase ErfK/SrfK